MSKYINSRKRKNILLTGIFAFVFLTSSIALFPPSSARANFTVSPNWVVNTPVHTYFTKEEICTDIGYPYISDDFSVGSISDVTIDSSPDYITFDGIPDTTGEFDFTHSCADDPIGTTEIENTVFITVEEEAEPVTTASEYYDHQFKVAYQDNLFKTAIIFLATMFLLIFYFMLKWKKS